MQQTKKQTNMTIIIRQSLSQGVLVQFAFVPVTQSKIRSKFPLHLSIFSSIPFLNTAGFFG